MARLLINPTQTAPMQTYYTQDNTGIMVPLEGYYFSDDKAMDVVIEFLIKEYGFELKDNKPQVEEETKKKKK